MNSNLTHLTKSHRALAAKKREKRNQIKEILFDEDARREFLTGFHKRKVAKQEGAKEKAKLREKQQRLDTRREHRRAIAERAAQNAAEVEKAYGAIIAEDEMVAFSGNEVDREVKGEYEGEEQLATVTVVEDFDPATLLHGPRTVTSSKPTDRVATTCHQSSKPNGGPKGRKIKKEKGKSIKYQIKGARRVERSKQWARRTEKAERAGGKSSRKSKRTHNVFK